LFFLLARFIHVEQKIYILYMRITSTETGVTVNVLLKLATHRSNATRILRIDKYCSSLNVELKYFLMFSLTLFTLNIRHLIFKGLKYCGNRMLHNTSSFLYTQGIYVFHVVPTTHDNIFLNIVCQTVCVMDTSCFPFDVGTEILCKITTNLDVQWAAIL
jgi:hypothetical protein